jgi:hypothetical protein
LERKDEQVARILTVVLVVQLALGVFVFWPRPAASSTGQPLLSDLKPEEITGLTITDDKGVTTKLAKSGDSWIAPDAGAYPADATKITPVLDKLIGIKTGKLIAQTAASQTQLQVADNKYVRQLEITKADGTSQTVYLGSPGGGQAVHVRLVAERGIPGQACRRGSQCGSAVADQSDLSVRTAGHHRLHAQEPAGEFVLTKVPRDLAACWEARDAGRDQRRPRHQLHPCA